MAHRSSIVLAAGSSSRFGANKLLVPVTGGRPLVRITAALTLRSSGRDVIVVLGHDAEQVRAALARLPVRFVDNPRFAEGLGGSVGAGAAVLPADCSAAVIVLGDQPVEPELIDALFALQASTATPIAAPVYRGVRRHPVVFSAALFHELRALHGHAGARVLIDADPARVSHLELDRPVPPDLDRPDEEEKLRRSLEERGLG